MRSSAIPENLGGIVHGSTNCIVVHRRYSLLRLLELFRRLECRRKLAGENDSTGRAERNGWIFSVLQS
jgi:hypothetical protein